MRLGHSKPALRPRETRHARDNSPKSRYQDYQDFENRDFRYLYPILRFFENFSEIRYQKSWNLEKFDLKPGKVAIFCDWIGKTAIDRANGIVLRPSRFRDTDRYLKITSFVRRCVEPLWGGSTWHSLRGAACAACAARAERFRPLAVARAVFLANSTVSAHDRRWWHWLPIKSITIDDDNIDL